MLIEQYPGPSSQGENASLFLRLESQRLFILVKIQLEPKLWLLKKGRLFGSHV